VSTHGTNDGGTVKKEQVTRRNPVAKSLNQYRHKTIVNKKKEAEKKREKSMKLLYRLEYLT
tara:strand:- start:408 stop:590 length:183 start_codon:yes stop_codon:yes gene_type:complete